MKLLCLTDIHGRLDKLAKILAAAGPVDAVLLGGDLTHFGSPAQAAQLVARTQLVCPRVFAVAGNCDSAAIDQRLAAQEVSLFGRGAALPGVALYGVSAMPPWRGTMYELTEEEIGEALEQGRAAALALFPEVEMPREVILAHPPPQGMQLDRTRFGEHVGSTELRRFIEEVQPALVVCGHVHEGRGSERLGKTLVVNCGPARDGCYAVVTLGEAVEVELARLAK